MGLSVHKPDCHHLVLFESKQYCQFAAAWGGVNLQHCRTSPRACQLCCSSQAPRSYNHVTASLAGSGLLSVDKIAYATRHKDFAPFYRRTFEDRKVVGDYGLTGGPGTELHYWFARWGFHPTPTCKCTDRAKLMDQKGCDWCERNVNLIVGWLFEEAGARRITPSPPASLLVNITKRCIKRARRMERDKVRVHEPGAAVDDSGAEGQAADALAEDPEG